MADFNFQEWMAKAKEDPKVAAQPVLVLVAIIFLAYKFVYSPQKIILTKKLKENKGVQDQIKGLEQAVANIEDLKLQVNEFNKSWNEVETRCYKKEEAPLFLQDIKVLGKKADLNIKNIAPMPPTAKIYETLNYELYPVKIGFSGSFKQLGTFLRILELHPKLIFLDLPNLEPDGSGTFKFDLIPTTILLGERATATAPVPEGG